MTMTEGMKKFLEVVNGGKMCFCAIDGGDKDDVCACVVYGVSTGDGSNDRCVCSIGRHGKSLN